MPSPLLIVLGISSTLLGLYITIVSVINPETQADFHIGTYLSIDTSRSHSIDLRSRYNNIQTQGEYNRKVDSLIKSTPIIDNAIHSKSLTLAHNIQSYIHTLSTTNTYQQSNMQYFTQLSTARQQYKNCTQQLSLTININENKHLWQSYKQCFVKYQKEKMLIDNLYTERRRLLNEIDDLMVYDPKGNKQFDIDQQLKKIKQRYDRENKQNDKNKQSLIIQLKRLQQKSQLKSTQFDENQRQYNRTKIEYQICLKNLKQFRKCEDIAKALRQYGYVETVESLEDRIKSKREILVKLRQHALQSRQAGGDNKVITQMYAKREKQLIQTIKLRLDMGYDEMKQCGCTQTQRKKLQKQYQQTKIKLSQSKKQLNQITYDIFSYQKRIKQTDKLRQQLINQFREDTQRLKNKQTTNILTLQQKLAVMKQNLKEVNQKLSNYSPRMNSIEFQCNQYKNRLGLKLNDGERVSDCMAKKMLYDGLKDKAGLIVKEEGTGLIEGKEKIKVLLQSIMYPQKLAIGSSPSSLNNVIVGQQQQHVTFIKEDETKGQQSLQQQRQQQQHQQITPETIIEVTEQQQLIITHPNENKVVIEHTQRVQVTAQPAVFDQQVQSIQEDDGL